MYYLDEDKAGVWQDIKTSWAVVVVPLEERLVLTPEVHSSNPVFYKKNYTE